MQVDFGCGSGSLLDSLLEHTTSLEKIVGVDISRKSLTRAAKVMHIKIYPFTLANVFMHFRMKVTLLTC